MIWLSLYGKKLMHLNHSFQDMDIRQQEATHLEILQKVTTDTICVPFLELITNLKSHFSFIQQKAVMGMIIVPSVLIDETTSISILV